MYFQKFYFLFLPDNYCQIQSSMDGPGKAIVSFIQKSYPNWWVRTVYINKSSKNNYPEELSKKFYSKFNLTYPIWFCKWVIDYPRPCYLNGHKLFHIWAINNLAPRGIPTWVFSSHSTWIWATTWKIFFGYFLGLYLLIFFVNYFLFTK